MRTANTQDEAHGEARARSSARCAVARALENGATPLDVLAVVARFLGVQLAQRRPKGRLRSVPQGCPPWLQHAKAACATERAASALALVADMCRSAPSRDAHLALLCIGQDMGEGTFYEVMASDMLIAVGRLVSGVEDPRTAVVEVVADIAGDLVREVEWGEGHELGEGATDALLAALEACAYRQSGGL